MDRSGRPTKREKTPDYSKLLQKRWVWAKLEGSDFIQGGTINYGFHGDIANDDFHPNIVEITHIYIKDLL